MASSLRRPRISRRTLLRGFALTGGSIGLLPLVGCDVLSPPAGTTTAAPTRPAPAAKPTPVSAGAPGVTPAPAATGLARDQAFRISLPGEPNGLDPSLAGDDSQAAVISQLFANLVRYRPNLAVEPDLAESWVVSPDGKTYTFKLRDARWSDGKPVTAGDFEYSFKRLLDPSLRSPFASFVHELKGAEAYNTALGTRQQPRHPSDAELQQLRAGVGVRALDEKTLQIELEAPAAYFLSLLPQANLAPVRQDVVERHGDRWTEPGKIVCCGPFVLDTWEAGSAIVLKRNPSYWDRPPTLDRIALSFRTDPAAAFAAYQRGELDVGDGVPDALIPQVRQDPGLSQEIVAGSQLATTYVGLDVRARPFDDRRVRRAFQMAVDTGTLCEKLLYGVPTPARSFIPPGMPGHQPEIGFGHDPVGASRLLGEAGFPDGKGFPEVRLVYPALAANRPQVEFVQAQVKQNLGLDITLEGREPETYSSRIAAERPPVYVATWRAGYPHPDGWLRTVYQSDSSQGYARFSNRDFDELNRQAAAERDRQKALALYDRAQRILVDEAPAIWLYWPGRFALAKPWVKGLRMTSQDPTPGALFWREVQILAR